MYVHFSLQYLASLPSPSCCCYSSLGSYLMSLVGAFTRTLEPRSKCGNAFSYIKYLSLCWNSTSSSVLLPRFQLIAVLGYEVQSLVIIISLVDAEFGLTIAAIPITIVILLFCAWSVRHESVPGMVISIVCFFGGLAYFLFKVQIGTTFLTWNSWSECINRHKHGNT